MKEANGYYKWFLSVAAYTTAGLASSLLVGFGIGLLGRLLPDFGIAAFGVGLPIASFVAVREMRFIEAPLPEWRRQTSSLWGKTFSPAVAATLWGADVGLVYTTFLTYSGPWLLFVLGLLSRDPSFSAALFGAHWLGRASTVWVLPWLIRRSGIALFEIVNLIARSRDRVGRIHALGAVLAFVVLVQLAAAGIPLATR